MGDLPDGRTVYICMYIHICTYDARCSLKNSGTEMPGCPLKIEPVQFRGNAHDLARGRRSLRMARTIDPLIGIAGRQTRMELSRARQSSSRRNLRLRETEGWRRGDRAWRCTTCRRVNVQKRRKHPRSNVVYRNL